jgi:hypothetical protein
MQVVADDFQQAKATMLFLLKLKTSYMDKLPWLFCGLAHCDEGVARVFGVKVRDAWLADPRREVHHRITWDLMKPGSFRNDLDKFIDGASRAQLSMTSRLAIAKFRFVPVVETTIEAKHQRTTMARKCHHIGPVRISLANRLPALERSIRSGHIDVADLLGNFQKARNIPNLAGWFGLQFRRHTTGPRATGWLHRVG